MAVEEDMIILELWVGVRRKDDEDGNIQCGNDQRMELIQPASFKTSESDYNSNNASLHACSNPPSITSMSS
uniref:Uncharacterized protein n=1 Tax=Salix viminalis TaxID=40686 RepID=A0A6N2M696_SALVM